MKNTMFLYTKLHSIYKLYQNQLFSREKEGLIVHYNEDLALFVKI